tara:strand:- start:107 stop:634 length:528 start_codon:yes stop_codon:yes gene_type:complete
MYDPDSPTNMFNYPMPTTEVGAEIFMFALIVLGFCAMFCMFPAFSMWLFSINQHKPTSSSSDSLDSLRPSTLARHKEYGYGYGKYRCVDDEAVYDEVVYEVEPPVERPVKRAAKPPVEPPVKVTDSKIIEEAITGLCSLGFKKTESKKVVNAVCNGCVFTDVEELIKSALDKSDV